MVKVKKTDKDKWYHLAKEQGYRSRAAYKLIQLNKKFNFLSGAKVCLDLCAAPGGWLQVAAKYMPVGSVVIGVDLLPIKPIRNVITLKEDITTQRCRTEIKKHLKTWRADIVLHDGAPNVGSAWAQDAYTQVTLTLSALGLATDFLVPGGWFVTKVFRSQDYNSLLWVFNKLFKKVTVTKPPASRNTSAEIFVVCQGYLAPKQLDPRFLDAKFVFKELDAPAEKELFLGQKKSSRHRTGYEEGVTVLFKKASVADFVEGDEAIEKLAIYNMLEFDERSTEYLNDRRTTDEIKSCFNDLKVLGKKDIKGLLRWRLWMRKKYIEGKKKKEEDGEEEDADLEKTEENEDEELDERIKRLNARKKQVLKKKRKLKSKLQHRIDIKMDIVGDVIEHSEDVDLFDLRRIKTKDQLQAVDDNEDADEMNSDDDEGEAESENEEELYDSDEYRDEMEDVLEEQYQQYLAASTSKSKKVLTIGKKEKKDRAGISTFDSMLEVAMHSTAPNKPSEFDSSDDEEEKTANPLLANPISDIPPTKRAAQWFSQSLFSDINEDDDDDEDEEENNAGEDVDVDYDEDEEEEEKVEVKATNKRVNKNDRYSKRRREEEEKEKEEEENENPRKRKKRTEDDFEVVPMQPIEDLDEAEKAELLAMATLVKSGQVKMSEMVDDGYNRFAFNDDNLPSWFADDEGRHNKPMPQVTKQMVKDVMDRWKTINARPIGKVGSYFF